MSDLTDLVSQYLGSQQVDAIAQQLGASREQTESAIGMALPTLLGAVSRKAENETEVQNLHRTLEHQDSDMLDQLGSLFSGGGAGIANQVQALSGIDMGSVLGGLLGGRQSKIEQGIGKASGLSVGQVASLLGMLAPFVMGALVKKTKSENMDAGGLSGMLRGERKQIENQASGGLMAGLLDQDGDGDFDFADIMKFGMNRIFGRK